MIKIIIPIDADTMEGTAALLKMNTKPGNRDAVNTAVAKIRQDGMVEIAPEILQSDEVGEALAGIVFLAIASSLPKE